MSEFSFDNLEQAIRQHLDEENSFDEEYSQHEAEMRAQQVQQVSLAAQANLPVESILEAMQRDTKPLLRDVFYEHMEIAQRLEAGCTLRQFDAAITPDDVAYADAVLSMNRIRILEDITSAVEVQNYGKIDSLLVEVQSFIYGRDWLEESERIEWMKLAADRIGGDSVDLKSPNQDQKLIEATLKNSNDSERFASYNDNKRAILNTLREAADAFGIHEHDDREQLLHTIARIVLWDTAQLSSMKEIYTEQLDALTSSMQLDPQNIAMLIQHLKQA